MKLERFDKFSQRIMDGEKVVGMALQLSNGRWGAYDENEKRLSMRSFAAPKDVLEYFELTSRALASDGKRGGDA